MSRLPGENNDKTFLLYQLRLLAGALVFLVCLVVANLYGNTSLPVIRQICGLLIAN